MRDFFNIRTGEVVKFTYKTLRDKKLADRIKAILIVYYGFTYDQIFQVFILD